jgi:hypothetical protein
VPRIILDFDPPQPEAPGFESDTADLVYFLSWAFSARYGGNHEMSVASLILRGEFGIDLRPLLTFADRSVEEPEDEDALERAWQEAAPLAETCTRVVEALASDERRLSELREEYPGLGRAMQELGRIAAWAAQQSSRIRVTYLLAEEPR